MLKPANVVGLMFVFVAATQLAVVVRIYKESTFQGIRLMTLISLRGRKALLLLLGFPVLIFGVILRNWLMIGIAMVALGGASLPPGIIYLAKSESAGFWFLSKLIRAALPIKVVHLLNSTEAGSLLFSQIDLFEYRVRSDWLEVVHNLCDIVPLIIIDSRYISFGVKREVEYVFNSGYQRRAIFITDENGNLPLLNYFDDQLILDSRFIFTLTAESAIGSLNGIGWRTMIYGKNALYKMIGDEIIL